MDRGDWQATVRGIAKDSDITQLLNNNKHTHTHTHMPGASQVALVVKNLPVNVGNVRNMGLILGSGRSPGGGHGKPLQCSCLENLLDRGPWWVSCLGSQRVGHD